MAEDFGVQGRGSLYEEMGTIRDVVQNHLFQVLLNLTMEPPVRTDSESIRDEKSAGFCAAMQDLDPKECRARPVSRPIATEKGGLLPTPRLKTFVSALKLEIDSWALAGRAVLHSCGASVCR